MARASSQNGPIDEPNISSYMLEESGEKVDSKAHEAEPSDLRLGISITNLSKIFKVCTSIRMYVRMSVCSIVNNMTHAINTLYSTYKPFCSQDVLV